MASLVYFLFFIIFFKESYEVNVEFDSDSWSSMLKGEWIIKFYAPWCPACRALVSTWEELGEWAEKDDVISLGGVDVTAQPGLNGRFMITALPTIYHVKDGVFRQYSGSRSLDDFKTFITEEKWKTITPISNWLSPSSYVMAGMSKVFDFSVKLKDLQETLNKDYGFPSWIALLVFGLFIIIGGLILGIALVFLTDYIWGPPQSYQMVANEEHKKNDDANIGDDDEPTVEKEKIQEDEDSTIRKRNLKQEEE